MSDLEPPGPKQQAVVEVTEDKPKTRRVIVLALLLVALAGIICNVILVLNDEASSEAMLTIAATCAGALGGMAMPGRDT